MCIDANHEKHEKVVENNQESMEIIEETVDLDDYDESFREEKWNVEVLAGGSLVEHGPIFSRDGKSIFVICNSVVRAFNISTGEWMFDLRSGDGAVVGMQLSITRMSHIIMASENGTVYHYDWKTGLLDAKIKLGVKTKIDNFKLIRHQDACVVNYSNAEGGKVDLFDYTTGKLIYNFSMHLRSKPVLFAIPVNHHKFFVVCQGHRINIIGDHLKKVYRYFKNFQHNQITCVEVHPTEECFATGDVSGRVILWREFFTAAPKPEIYHWHHSPVATVAFSESGTFFYTGGSEAVLVKWTVNQPDQKQFLPRMSAGIAQIVVGDDNSKVVVATKDNAIYIHDAQLQLLRTVQYFTFMADDGTEQSPFPVGLKIDPRTQALVLNGRMGHLQFYATKTHSLLYNLDVTIQNIHTQEKDKILYNTRVTHVALNQEWMATSECWNDQEHAIETRLKFWFFDETKQSFILNTSVESPHEKEMTAMEFSSPHAITSLVCASAAHDRNIRIWAMEQSKNIHRKSKVWMCSAILSYKNLPVQSLTFSRDCSLLSAGFGYVLCCWDIRTLKLKCTLNAPSGLDGSIAKVVLTVPKKSKKSIEKRQKANHEIIQNFLQTNDNKLVKNLTESKTKKLDSLTIEDKKMALQLLQESNHLDLHRKVQLITKLEIPLKINETGRTALTGVLTEKLENLQEKQFNMLNRIGCLKNQVRYKTQNRFRKFAKQERDENWFLTFVTGVERSKDEKLDKDLKEQEFFVAPAQIRHVIFGAEEYSHLVLVTTDEKVLVWNLLTMRLVCSFFLSVQLITIDEQTNLLAAFTDTNELHVFHINSPLTYHVQKDLPQVYGAVWIPREQPLQNSLHVNWQAQSELYIFTQKQQLVKLSTNKLTITTPLPHLLPRMGVKEGNSTFSRMLAGKTLNETARPANSKGDKVLQPSKAVVQELLSLQPHTAPPMRTICGNFMRALIKKEKPESAQEAKTQSSSNKTDVTGIKMDVDDSDAEAEMKKTESNKDKQIAYIWDSDDDAYNEELEKELEKINREIDFSNLSLEC